MADREALRELQERLAGRLQAAKTEDLTMAWLAVRAGPRNYLLPLTQAGEIAALADIQPLPYVQPWFAGVINCVALCTAWSIWRPGSVLCETRCQPASAP